MWALAVEELELSDFDLLTDSLTDRQRGIFDFIRDKIRGRGYGPTVREIGEQFGIASPNGVMCHLKALERKGLISRSPKQSRAIELLQDDAAEERGMQLAGTVNAGMATLAFEQQDRVDFGDMFSGENHFALRVSGESMIDAHIADGDYVVVRKQKTAARGQMVVAETDEGEATLKYWFPEKNRIRLQPANAEMGPIYLKKVKVVGVVVGVISNVRR